METLLTLLTRSRHGVLVVEGDVNRNGPPRSYPRNQGSGR